MSEDFVRMEHELLHFWEEQQIFAKLREKNREHPYFRFLDGPITANNPMGIHHAWGRTLKDAILRYKAMQGYACQYRNGFDTQGLWVEVEVEKALGFTDKRDVERYGLDRFTRSCLERIQTYAALITEQSKRLGQWMDWPNSYYTHSDENIAAIWHFLKTCHERGWIEQASCPMPWCPRCGTSLSEHEMTGSHKDVVHQAVFALAPALDADIDFLVWTTTPWTLAANAALAIHPQLDYALLQLERRPRPLVVAKAALDRLPVRGKVLEIAKGERFLDLAYQTFLPQLTVQQGLHHRLIPWSDISADEGSGIVHIAPGCGAEDYQLGLSFDLAQICPVDERGRFTADYAGLSGLEAGKASDIVFALLKEQGTFFHSHDYQHSYPVCWRCKTEVLFRLVQEWYIRTEEIRPQLLEAVRQVAWSPEYLGKRMEDWLLHMGDWNISRKRFYGLPLPFYPCPHCGELTVIGSRQELIERGGEAAAALSELHRPWIDEVQIRCPRCGQPVQRIPEVGDVWLDAGITAFSTLGYFEDRSLWQQLYPIEWVIEMREQVRLWFYSLLFMSVTLTGRAPYERVSGYGSVVAEDGSKFSKTGFMIRFDEAAERLGSDAIRYLYAGANPGNDMRFGYKLGEEARRKLLGLWNIYSFFTTYAEIDRPRISAAAASQQSMDRWLSSRLNSFVAKATLAYERYDTAAVVRESESCIEDISNWYVRVSRKRFWQDGMNEDKQNAYDSLYHALKKLVQVMAPIIPFMCERIWQKMIRPYGEAEESVHLSAFPSAEVIDQPLLEDIDRLRQVVATTLSLRNTSRIKLKQPLSLLYLDSAYQVQLSPYLETLQEELNIKEVRFLDDFSQLSRSYLSLDFRRAGQVLKEHLPEVKKALDDLDEEAMHHLLEQYRQGEKLKLAGEELATELFLEQHRDHSDILRSPAGTNAEPAVALNIAISPELHQEGIYRELLRQCQVLRKEAGFAVTDRICLDLHSDSAELLDIIAAYRESLQRETLSRLCTFDEARRRITLSFNEGTLTIGIKAAEDMRTI